MNLRLKNNDTRFGPAQRPPLALSCLAIIGTLLLQAWWPAMPAALVAGPQGEKLGRTQSNLNLFYDRIEPANFPRIVSYVTVSNDSGFSIGELTKDNFEVREDGVRELPIEVVELTDSVGISVALVLDRSSSMKDQPIIDAREAAKLFVDLMNPLDEAAVVSFASTVRTDHPFSTDKNSLRAAIDQIEAKGGTAIYDAVIHTAQLIRPVLARRAIILMTDGHDKDSQSTFQQALDAVSPLHVPVFTIGLNLGRGSPEEQVLIDLAAATGGRYYYSPSSDELAEIYRMISALLHHLYRVTYTTHNPARDGTIRHVRIDVLKNAATASDTASYRAPLDLITLAPTASEIAAPARDLTIDVEITPDSYPAFFMRDLEFVLKYDPAYLQVNAPQDQRIVPSPLYGGANEHDLQFAVDQSRGEISIKLAAKPATDYINGRGKLISIRFSTAANLPDNYALRFSLQNAAAMNKDNKDIPVIVRDLTLNAYGWVTVALASTDAVSPGRRFRLDAEIPANGKSVPEMATLTFELRYNRQALSVPQPVASAFLGSAFFGAAEEYDAAISLNAGAGTIKITLTKKSGRAPAQGRGQVARMAFDAALQLADSTLIKFEFVSISARDASGWQIPIRGQDLTLSSYGLIVWPGDTNHNGTVELTDVTVLGVYWKLSGPGRPDAPDPLAWVPQFAGRYAVRNAAHADADGSGEISERDLIPIGLNWRKTTSNPARARVSPPHVRPLPGMVYPEITSLPGANLFRVSLKFDGHDAGLQGITFRLQYATARISLRDVQPGSAWPAQPLFLQQNDPAEGILAVGIMQVAGAPAVNQPGTLAEIVVESPEMPAAADLRFYDIALVAADGNIHEVGVDLNAPGTGGVPEVFSVSAAYPNPFNPQTVVRLSLPEAGGVEIRIFDVRGRQIFQEGRDYGAPGTYFWQWHGQNRRGELVGSGVYFARFEVRLANGQRRRVVQRLALVQ